jgi:hypothetical protein
MDSIFYSLLDQMLHERKLPMSNFRHDWMGKNSIAGFLFARLCGAASVVCAVAGNGTDTLATLCTVQVDAFRKPMIFKLFLRKHYLLQG